MLRIGEKLPINKLERSPSPAPELSLLLPTPTDMGKTADPLIVTTSEDPIVGVAMAAVDVVVPLG